MFLFSSPNVEPLWCKYVFKLLLCKSSNITANVIKIKKNKLKVAPCVTWLAMRKYNPFKIIKSNKVISYKSAKLSANLSLDGNQKVLSSKVSLIFT